MIVTKNDTSTISTPRVSSSPSSVIQRDGLLLDPRQDEKFQSMSTSRRTQRSSLPSPSDDNQNLRRIRSDSHAQSKRDDPNTRRSIFGHYFKEEPRSYSVNSLESGHPPPPIPLRQQQNPKQPDQNHPTTPIRRAQKRSSWSSSIDSLQELPPTPEMNVGNIDKQMSRRVQIHNHPSTQANPVDYRLFVPSEEQIAESAICCRYRELNKEHQKDYDSLLEHQVQIEQSLPPFPSPLVRFCSDTTARVAEHDAASNPQRKNSETKSYFFSADGEMHYHGVYSLLKPCSILKPSRYSSDKADTTTSLKDCPNASSNRKINPVQSETEEKTDNLSVPLSSSFNFPRSYIETSAAILNQYSSSKESQDPITNIENEGEEEKKESDLSFGSSSDSNATLPRAAPISESSSSSTSLVDALSENDALQKDISRNGSQDVKSENSKETNQNKQHFRFDPRVTVTEFEDPVPRTWYDDCELEVHKREAIVLAQSYLRKHPAVAEWYRRAILDPITKTYRKRALFSLPVFSSTFKGNTADVSTEIIEHKNDIQNLEDGLIKSLRGFTSPALMKPRKPLATRVKKILVVHPYEKIASLFSKSMKSMFPSAKLVTTRSPDEALRLIEESLAASKNNESLSLSSTSIDSASGFDIIIVEQHLSPKSASSPPSSPKPVTCDEVFNPLGFLDIFFKRDGENSQAALTTPTNSDIRRGSDLIYLMQEFSSSHSRCASSLIIGVSVKPERDASLMKQAGADIVWGIPIPKVGEKLRNKLFSKLHAKRSGSSLPSPKTLPFE